MLAHPVTSLTTTDILVSLVGTLKERAAFHAAARFPRISLPFGYKALPRPASPASSSAFKGMIRRHGRRGNTALVHVSRHFNGCLGTGYIKPLSILSCLQSSFPNLPPRVPPPFSTARFSFPRPTFAFSDLSNWLPRFPRFLASCQASNELREDSRRSRRRNIRWAIG